MSKENEKKPETVAAVAVAPSLTMNDVKLLIKGVMEEALPAAVAAVQAGQAQAYAARPVAVQKPKCLKCGQPSMACGDRHRKSVIFVSGPYSRWFQGLQVNGVTYLSNNAAHAIVIPADLNEGHAMELFRAAEERFMTAKTFDHSSGIISAKGNNQLNPIPEVDL